MRGVILLCAAVLGTFGSPAAAGVIGRADVIDGDTIKVAGTSIRLQGIDAPESLQACIDTDGREWACGKAATQALAKLLAAGPVACDSAGKDRYGRLLAFCRTGEIEVNRWLVAHGWAWAFVKYDARYLADERRAKSANLGIWKGKADPPWDWRAGQTVSAPPETSGGCRIKGNVSANGERIYHLPWQHAYGKTRIDRASGERWFCSETEALSAGWRRALR
jgi:endonuclease YncB( thermonuclease family)